MTTVVGILLGLAALTFGVIAVVAPGRLAARFRDRRSWSVDVDHDLEFSPRTTQVGGVVVGLAGVALVVMGALGVFA